MQQTDGPKQIKRSEPTAHVVLWGLLGCCAAIYLGIAVARPDLLAGMTPGQPQSGPQSNEGQRALSDALTEMKSLQENLSKVQEDVSSMRTELSSRSDQDALLATRLAALETKPGKAGQPAPVPAAAAKAAAAPKPAPVAAVPATAHAVAPAAPAAIASNSSLKLLNASPAAGDNPVVTGSVAPQAGDAAPVEFGTAVVTPASKPMGIQIATGPSVDSLRLSWNLLTERHSESLKSLEPRYVGVQDANGETYDLVAGPLKSAADAQKVCKALLAKAVPCKVSEFAGDAL